MVLKLVPEHAFGRNVKPFWVSATAIVATSLLGTNLLQLHQPHEQETIDKPANVILIVDGK